MPTGDRVVPDEEVSDQPPTASNPQNATATATATATTTTTAASRNSRTPSFSSARSSSLLPKSKHAEPGLTEVHADQASLSMPPPQSRPVKNPRAALPQSRRDSNNSEAGNDDTALRSRAVEAGSLRSSSSLRDVIAASDGTEDSETPRMVPGACSDKVEDQPLPEPAMPSSRSSFSENDNATKRMSVSSVYSMASARGIPSSAASANGSDTGSAGTPRSVSGLMASSTGKPGDAGVSNVVVTTGSQGSAGGNLAPREQQHHLPDILKRSHGQIPRSDPSGAPRPQQVSRDRSRAKRRLSGSTAASSHSPSSDRTLHHKEKEEGSSVLSPSQTVRSLTDSAAKPAPLGLIGVCALDVKARSKPSRNILNRLLANREFDVKIFGDKVILDEGKSPADVFKHRH